MVCDHFLSAVLADRQAEAHTADKKQALDCLPPTLSKSPNPAEKENKTLERFFDLLDVMDMEW